MGALVIVRLALKACVVCGAQFRAGRKAVCCSTECRRQRANAQRKAWNLEHKRELTAYWRKYHAEHRKRRSKQAAVNYRKRKGAA